MKAVLDTNIVIYLQKGLLVGDLPFGEYLISVITEMELFSFPDLNEHQRIWLRRFVGAMEIVGLDGAVKRRAIALRREHRLKLPDAIIAATAIGRNAVLYSNDRSFAGVPNLKCHELVLAVGP